MSNKANVVTSLNVPSQLPLDYKIWYKKVSDITLGENDYLAYSFYQGMIVYCAEERIMYEWNEESKVHKSETHKLFPEHFVYPSDMPEVNGVEYADKKYNFFQVDFRNENINIEDYVTEQEFRETIDAILEDILINKGDIAYIKGELGIIEGKINTVNEAIANLKNYTDAQNEALKAEMELRDKALQDELTDAEARQLLALENQRRDLEAQIARQSELLLESVQDLQNSLDDATTNLQNSINNLQVEINNLPTNVQLTKAQLDNLKMLANIIDQEYKDVNFKANVVLRDKFLPASEKPAIEALQLDCRTKHNALQNAISQAISDSTLTEAELDDINDKIDTFRLSVQALNDHLLEVYDLLSDNMEQYYLNLIDSKIVEVEFLIQYSANGSTGWHNPPFIEGVDKYMRMKNGEQSAWSDPMKIVGEDGTNGTNGVYTVFEFALSDSLSTAPTSGWQDAPPTPTTEKPYLWCRTGTVVPPATQPSSWTGFSMSGPAGPPGEGTSTVISSVEPEDKELGMIWIDTGVSPIQQKYWDGNMWIIVGLTQSDLTNAIQTANDELKETMESALEDGIISAQEAQNIANNIASLKSTKRVLDAQTNIVRNDPALGSVEKANLTTAKTNFDIKHNDLLAICETIASQTSVTPAQVQNYNLAQTAYDTALENLTRELELAQNNILANTVGGIQVGGRNLLLDTRRTITNANYNIANYDISDSTLIREGEEYTITIWGTLASGRTKFVVYNDNTSNALGDLGLVAPGVYSGTFRWNSRGVANTQVKVYQSPTGGTGSSTINYIKLERGNRYSDWSPAPEDVQQGIDTAILNAANAEAIANAARDRVNFLTVSIDPDIGLIIGSTLMVGNSAQGNAFITGVTDRFNDEGEDISIRFGAGPGGYVNKETVPFRVNDKGELFASRGEIAGFELSSDGLLRESLIPNSDPTKVVNSRLVFNNKKQFLELLSGRLALPQQDIEITKGFYTNVRLDSLGEVRDDDNPNGFMLNHAPVVSVKKHLEPIDFSEDTRPKSAIGLEIESAEYTKLTGDNDNYNAGTNHSSNLIKQFKPGTAISIRVGDIVGYTTKFSEPQPPIGGISVPNLVKAYIPNINGFGVYAIHKKVSDTNSIGNNISSNISGSHTYLEIAQNTPALTQSAIINVHASLAMLAEGFNTKIYVDNKSSNTYSFVIEYSDSPSTGTNEIYTFDGFKELDKRLIIKPGKSVYEMINFGRVMKIFKVSADND